MDSFVIEGGSPLNGQLRINGSKNAALPLLAASMLTAERVVLRDCPDLSDIRNMLVLLTEMGVDRLNARPAGVSERDAEDPNTIELHADPTGPTHARYDIVRTMRAGICVLGPALARRGAARVSLPGGCAIGDRPIDLHLRGLEALGATIELQDGDVIARAPRNARGKPRLRGAKVFLGGPNGSTVLGTANVMSAATLAEGTTTIEAAACAPELVDLAQLLTSMGARITGAGSPRIKIDGVERLTGCDHTVIPDRIEAGTFIAMAATTRGRLELTNCPLEALLSFQAVLSAAGIELGILDAADPMRAHCVIDQHVRPRSAIVTTQPPPGFATDLQAPTMALLATADGNSIITERIFPERFLHVAELTRMGAQLFRQGATVVVSGIEQPPGLSAPGFKPEARPKSAACTTSTVAMNASKRGSFHSAHASSVCRIVSWLSRGGRRGLSLRQSPIRSGL